MTVRIIGKKRGEEIAYQGRKRARTSNLLVLVDEKGLPLAFGDILSGNHNDLFEVLPQFSKMCKTLKANEIKLEN